MIYLLMVLVVVAAALAAQRFNKVRRDRRRRTPAMVWPTDPTRPSGFRLVGDDYEAPTSEVIQRPRLDPARSYVFSENGEAPAPLTPSTSSGRERWALSHSASRSRLPKGSWKLLAVTTTVLVALVVTGSLLATR